MSTQKPLSKEREWDLTNNCSNKNDALTKDQINYFCFKFVMLSIIRRLRRPRIASVSGNMDENSSESASDQYIPPPISSTCLLRRIPMGKENLLAMQMEKADCSGKWHKRRVILTRKFLLFTREDEEYIREEIPLNLIKKIQKITKHSSTKELGIHFKNIEDSLIDAEDQRKFEFTKDKLKNPNSAANSFQAILGQTDVGWYFDVFAYVEELKCDIKYSLRAATMDDMEKMIHSIWEERSNYLHGKSGAKWLQLQRRLREIYDRYTSWGLLAGLLVTNFLVDVVQSEIQPPTGSKPAKFFYIVDVLFTALFTLDISINFLSHSFRAFVARGWNVLDTFIISFSIASLVSEDLSSVNTFRTIRAIRTVRLLRGVSKLREIVDALLASVSFVNSPRFIFLIAIKPLGPI